MAIDGINGIGGPRRPERSGATASGKASAADRGEATDRIEVSARAREIAAVSARVGELPDVRQERIDNARRAIDNGTYQVDARRLAGLILEFEDGLRP